ncbi:hypothetical protein [Streptomyces massasporeus]|uniref:hypothetical protein n=1 Tax=Streptomyces massasporeus TaxID=67324 RepID=UPI00371EF7BC
MAADQLPAAVGEFVTYLDGLLARLDPSGGWCAVFWQRDPEGMRACLDGRDVPPWDVVEALLQDLAGQYGPGGAGPETERARALHAAALAAYDTRPGGRDALGDRLDVMFREQKYAAERQAALARHLTSATTPEQADALRLDLAWARDDHERAAARCTELRARMALVDRREQGAPPATWGDGDGLHGAGPGSPAPTQQRSATGSASAAPGGRYGTGAPGVGSPGRQSSVAGGFSGEVPADAASAPAPTGSLGRSGSDAYGTGAPGVGSPGRQSSVAGGFSGEVPADAASTPAPTGSSGRSGSDAPEVGRSDRQHQVSRGAVGEPAPGVTPDALSAPAPAPAPKPRKRRRGSARFAGMLEEEAVPVVVPPAVVPTLPAPAPAPVTTGRTPRGARFAGVGDEAVVEPPVREGGAVGAVDLAEVGRTVDLLARLRAEGRSGEAHALLAEVASWEPGRFPMLAERLHIAGLDADWQTLLWEAAALPAGRLVAAADALVEAGRAGDGQQMLRQGVARPPGEVGEAVLGLAAERRHREVRVLLDAYVRARTPEEAARSAEPDPRRLVPLLLEAAQGVSDERRWDLVHALRVAGFAA